MNSIPAQDIKRRGISALDKLLEGGPVHVIKNNRPCYVVLTEADYARLVERRDIVELLDRPTRANRSKRDIDAQLHAERASWGGSR